MPVEERAYSIIVISGTALHVTHEQIDQRSLAMHLEMAEMIRGNPELYDRVRNTLGRWISTGRPVPPALQEWQSILDTRTVGEVLEIISTDTEDCRRLRQSSPFCILPQERRDAIFREFHTQGRNASTLCQHGRVPAATARDAHPAQTHEQSTTHPERT
jgi:hypothetical protein